jgi:phenylacetate-coenzyme A ligase PaaK-like adenylate-forming protein
MKPRLFLIHWVAKEADKVAKKFRTDGWQVEHESRDVAHALSAIKAQKPEVVVIYLTRDPWRGQDAADTLRAARETRSLSLIFVGEGEAIEKTKSSVPEVVYASPRQLKSILRKYLPAPKPTPASKSIDQELAQLIKHAYAHAPAVKEIFDDVDVKPSAIKHVADLERVPVTSKDRLIELQKENPPFGGFLAEDLHRIKRIFQSPGPIYEPRGVERLPDRTAAEIFRAARFKRGDIVLNTLSYHLSPGGWILDGGLEALGAVVIPGGVGNVELQMQMLRDLKVDGYAGTPSFLMTILNKAQEIGIDVRKDLALKNALFTGEPYPPSLREQFEGTFGLKTTNVYATAELGFLAFDCATKNGLHFAEGAIIQICSMGNGKPVAAGEVGEIVVTALNETYPLVRFGTGDLATYDDTPCACGRTSPRLTLVGRAGDAVKVRGMFVHPNQLRLVASKFSEIAHVQGVVSRPNNVRDEFTLRVVLGRTVKDRDALSKELTGAVRELCRVGVDDIDFVNSIPENARVIVDERKWE